MAFKIPDTPEELFRQGKKSFDQLSRWIPFLVALLTLLGIVLTSFYIVEPEEVGVIRRFGKYHRTTYPGLHWKFPFNIEKLNKVKITHVFTDEFGFRTVRPGVRTQYAKSGYEEESIMLTGDLNVLDVTWILQYKVKDPVKILFNIKDPRETVRNISEAVMRLVIGDSSVSEALTLRRDQINIEAQKKMQEILDSYESGIQIDTVKLQTVVAPEEVQPSFNEVNEAEQEREKMINEAKESYNRVIPRASGEAEKTIREAEGYALKRVNEARGDAARFLETWQAYKIARDVTERRMYLETLAEILPKAKEIYIMEKGGIPLLPFLDLKREDKQ